MWLSSTANLKYLSPLMSIIVWFFKINLSQNNGCLNRINIYVIYKLRYWPSWSPFFFLYLGALFHNTKIYKRSAYPTSWKAVIRFFCCTLILSWLFAAPPLLVGGCVSGWSANLPNCLLIFHISTMFSSLISIFTDVWIFTTVMIQNRIQRCYGSNGVLWPWPSSYPIRLLPIRFCHCCID